jgi:endonuclease/exonuclease/phosphatase family metal-dependent hydrolase
MFWRDGVNLKARLKSKYHIDAEITEEDGSKWRFTGIYGEPKLEGREATWCLLRTIRHHSDKPWICAGDFNEILMQCEKEGGTARTQIYMDRFNEALEDCGLHDLGFTGDPFTWHNNSHDASRYIRERLDRVVATQEWCNKFMSYRVEHGDPRHSDHRPVIIHINEDVPVQRRSTIKRP